MLPLIEKLNQFPPQEFNEKVHILFETAPALSSKLYSTRPFSSYAHLIDEAQKIISNLSESDKLAVVNAHPRIGANQASLSAQSKIEQGSEANHQVLATLAELNQKYEDKFGFKFIVFVNGRQKHELIPVIQERMLCTRDQELETGLDAMILIARDRLKKMQSNL